MPVTRTRGFAIAAALTLSFGGFVIPVAGWVVGVVLVLFSSMWHTVEKAVAIVVPFVLGGLSRVAVMTMWRFAGQASGGSPAGPGSAADGVNPLVPAWYDLVFTGAVFVGILLIPASGLWLLWRMRGRTAA